MCDLKRPQISLSSPKFHYLLGIYFNFFRLSHIFTSFEMKINRGIITCYYSNLRGRKSLYLFIFYAYFPATAELKKFNRLWMMVKNVKEVIFHRK